MLSSLLARLPRTPPATPVSRPRRAFQLLIVATLLPATTLGPAVLQAHADDQPIRIPLHTESSAVWLLGASSTGVAVAQGFSGTVYSGAWDEALLPRPQAVASRSSGAGTSGSTLAYTVAHPDATAPWTEPRRLNMLTGEDITDVSGGVSDPVFAEGGWVAEDVPSGLNGNLRWYPSDGSSGKVLWRPDGKQLTGFAAEGSGLLVAYATYLPTDDFWKPTGPHRLDLIDLNTGSEQRIVSSTARISQPLLTADRAVWVTVGSAGSRVLNSAPRAGGTATEFTETVSTADLSKTAGAEDGTIGYPLKRGVLRLVKDGRKTDVKIPAGSGGLDTVGNDFYTATGGTPAMAGIYRIRSGKAERVRALPRAEHEVAGWAFDHGVLRYLDRSGSEPDQLALWTRVVQDADGTPAVGIESSAPTLLNVQADAAQEPQISFDAGRGAIPSRKYLMQWDLVDRNRRTGTAVEQTPIPDASGNPVQRAGKPVVSGPYVLLNGLVHRADGELLHTEPVRARQAGQDAIFGSRLVYGLVSADGQDEVWSVDAEDPAPVRLASGGSCNRAPETAVWGGLSAWTSCDASSITIGRVTGGGTPRTVASGLSSVGRLGLTMNGTALGWVADRTAYVLDLARPTSTPIALDGDTRRIVIDGRSVVREVHRENAVPATVLQVEKLPFAVNPSPRLTGRVAPIAFTPNGDGKRDTWAPQFDTTTPLASASLRLVSQRSGKAVRTLTTRKVSDGSIRLVWTGRTGGGKKAAVGPYRWTLTARDGSGALVTTDGRGPVTGTVWISR